MILKDNAFLLVSTARIIVNSARQNIMRTYQDIVKYMKYDTIWLLK